MEDKRILIIGGTGSLGKTLIKKYQDNNTILVVSRDEQKQASLAKESWLASSVHFTIGDIKDIDSIKNCLLKFSPQVVINTAALKHIDICEKNPLESIKVNILGNVNLINAMRSMPRSYIDRTLIFVSTDKACKPINTYGMCKAISEKLYLDYAKEEHSPDVKIVRYGNVLNSNGSVIPYFQKLLKEGATELPITDERMTRFLISLEEACDLIDWAYHTNSHGKIAVPKLKSFKILDLAKVLLPSGGARITGIRPGEKLHEELISPEEWLCTEEYDNGFLIGDVPKRTEYKSYASDDDIASLDELHQTLVRGGVL